jgi:hypothetical protein
MIIWQRTGNTCSSFGGEARRKRVAAGTGGNACPCFLKNVNDLKKLKEKYRLQTKTPLNILR